MPTFERAPALEPGDTVGLIAPSEPLSRALVAPAAERLRERFDLAVRRYPTTERDPEDGPAPPAERARDVHDAVADCEAVMALLGGDDQLRVLGHLDADRLREADARIFGYSDNDNLRLFCWRLGTVSYGVQAFPDLAVGDELHPYVAEHLRRALFEDGLGVVEPSTEWTQELYDFEGGGERAWRDNPGPTWRDRGPVAGRVWGGAVSVVGWHLQTDRYLPEPAALDGAVLALETAETVPPPRRVGYLLRSMGERGLLERFDGVLVGRPRTAGPEAEREPDHETYAAALREAVEAELDRYCPATTAAFGLDFGHTEPSFPLPLGARARLDPGAGELAFD